MIHHITAQFTQHAEGQETAGGYLTSEETPRYARTRQTATGDEPQFQRYETPSFAEGKGRVPPRVRREGGRRRFESNAGCGCCALNLVLSANNERRHGRYKYDGDVGVVVVATTARRDERADEIAEERVDETERSSRNSAAIQRLVASFPERGGGLIYPKRSEMKRVGKKEGECGVKGSAQDQLRKRRDWVNTYPAAAVWGGMGDRAKRCIAKDEETGRRRKGGRREVVNCPSGHSNKAKAKYLSKSLTSPHTASPNPRPISKAPSTRPSAAIVRDPLVTPLSPFSSVSVLLRVVRKN
ncbi:hypothetical protein NMY22_g8555 [Coprinellus aureogranulatus]|nr:hypothetical protein NMY22_g8555 [Coprinellus aureogranulatus]